MGSGGTQADPIDAAEVHRPAPRRPYRLRELPPRARLAVVVVLLALVATPLVAAGLLLHRGWQPLGDRAIIALRSTDVVHAHGPQVGQPTTGEGSTGIVSSHPGPAEFWLLAPFTSTLGPRAGAALGTALLGSVAIGATLLLALRGGGPSLVVALGVGVALLVRSLGAFHLVDPMNSEVVALLLLVTAVAAWSVLLGDAPAIPVFFAAATVLAQVHVTGAAYALPLVVVVVGSLAWRARRRAWRRRVSSWLWLAGGIGVLGWLPPLAHDAAGGPSNVAALWRTARADEAHTGFRVAGERLVAVLGPRPVFTDGPGGLAFFGQRPAVVVLAVGAALGVLASLALVHRQRGGAAPATLALVVGVVAATSAVVTASIPRADSLRPDANRPLATVACLVWVGLAWSAWCLVPKVRRSALGHRVERVGAGVVAVVLLATLASSARPSAERDGDVMAVASEVQDELVARVPDGTYRIEADGSDAFLTFLPGVVARLERAGSRVYVGVGGFSRAYGAGREFHGQPVDGVIVLRTEHLGGGLAGSGAAAGQAPRPEGRPVAEARGGGVELLAYLERS